MLINDVYMSDFSYEVPKPNYLSFVITSGGIAHFVTNIPQFGA